MAQESVIVFGEAESVFQFRATGQYLFHGEIQIYRIWSIAPGTPDGYPMALLHLCHGIGVGSSKRTENNDLNSLSFIMERRKPYMICIWLIWATTCGSKENPDFFDTNSAKSTVIPRNELPNLSRACLYISLGVEKNWPCELFMRLYLWMGCYTVNSEYIPGAAIRSEENHYDYSSNHCCV